MNQAGSSWIEQLKPVLETLNQGVVINDVNGCVVFANGVFQEMLGLPPEAQTFDPRGLRRAVALDGLARAFPPRGQFISVRGRSKTAQLRGEKKGRRSKPVRIPLASA